MKLILTLTCLFLVNLGMAQPLSKYFKERVSQMDTIRELVRTDQIEELSHRIHYPLKRGGLLSTIETPEDFISAYPYIFDEDLKERLESPDLYESDCFTKDVYMAVLGSLWIGPEGKIFILGNSQTEGKIADSLRKEMHPSVGKWYKNEMFCSNDQFTFIVDNAWYGSFASNGNREKIELRLLAWASPDGISDKPGLVLMDGIRKKMVEEPDYLGDSLYGETITFIEGNFTYQIDNIAHRSTGKSVEATVRIHRDGRELAKTKAGNYPIYPFEREKIKL